MGAVALLSGLLALLAIAPVHAAGPQDDLRDADAAVAKALVSAQAGDLAAAAAGYRAFENRWFDIEDGVREVSRDAYRAIEAQMSQVGIALAATPPSKDAVAKALAALDAQNRAFIAGQPPLAAVPTSSASTATVAALLDLLSVTRAAAQAGDWTKADTTFDAFSAAWSDVEGQVKTRSATDYRATEDDMARVTTAISAKSPDAVRLIDGMASRLAPYRSAAAYHPFDATIIIFREGMEAMLVVVALLAFVKRSDSADRSAFVWYGAGIGLFASLALGVAINTILGSAFSGEHRELLEGFTGLFAAAMLLYVSYWLHSKSSLGAWQSYISDRTTRALASGSLYGLAALSFLAVFREGGETVLFFLGMAGNISTGDLLLGLAAGAGILVVIGFLLTVAGLKIPLRPFFMVASVLTFYLCFKFLGTGVHALQVAGLLPAAASAALPANDTLGLYPTWQSTLPQVVLLAVGIAVWLRGAIADRARARAGTQARA